MELQANELRIGNLVEMLCDGKTFITKIDVGDFMDINRAYKIVCGIPISEDILFKIGFEKKSFYVVGAGSCLKWELAGFTLLKNLDDNFYIPTIPKNIVLESLHKLQNVYYYMNNGQELNTAGLIS